jgi:hypothetical protein
MDKRLLPANERVGWVGAKPRCDVPNLVKGTVKVVTDSFVNILSSPNGVRIRQLLYGSRFRVLEEKDNFSFGFSESDGYVGYIESTSLGKKGQSLTHWVSALATHVYAKPDIKKEYRKVLSFGSKLEIESATVDFFKTTDGGYIPKVHLKEIGTFYSDPAKVAEKFLDVPYLWGGNSCWGIDCSGIIQMALSSCSIICPGDSDQQEASFEQIPTTVNFNRNDLIFWDGHVALIISSSHLIHANAFNMSVKVELIEKVIERIKFKGDGDFRLCQF